MDYYTATQMKDRIVELENRIVDLEKRTKNVVDLLFTDISQNTENTTNTRDISQPESFIDSILNDPSTNSIMPDSLERIFYRKILQFVLKAVEKIVQTTRINLFDHQITMDINPV